MAIRQINRGAQGLEGVTPITTIEEQQERDRSGVQLPSAQGAASLGNTLGTFEEEQARLGGEDLQKAREGTETLKERFIDQDPFGEAAERVRTGVEAGLGRQAQIEQQRLQASLERLGPGVNPLRRFAAQTDLNAGITNRFLQAEGQLGELQITAADKQKSAINDFVGNFLNIAQAQGTMFSRFFDVFQSLRRGSGGIRIGGRSTSGGSRSTGGGPLFDFLSAPTRTGSIRGRQRTVSSGSPFSDIGKGLVR